ncbi:1-deoxy-D-xylulose-5-phosphate reductoisomerase [Fibrobacterota bacterium]
MTAPKEKKSICLLGATGSIGASTLQVIGRHRDRFRLHSVAAATNWEGLLPGIEEFKAEKACLWDPEAAKALSDRSGIKALSGMEGLLELVTDPQVDYVVNGLVGAIGCEPTLEAIKSSKHIGLANKETMVTAGEIINRALQMNPDSRIIPIDSEHSAIFQCLSGRPGEEVEAILLTASGGPFRTLPPKEFSSITRTDALNHPTWDMGPKITIDSATMMNKGLEVIEAHYLFNLSFDQINIVIHPSSTIHSFVQFRDGSLMAQLGSPDMRLPILYALTCPERLDLDVDRLNITDLTRLEFFPPDPDKFPCIQIAYRAGRMGGTAPAVINAANEEAVALFLQEKISFADIPETIDKVLTEADIIQAPDLKDVQAADAWARKKTAALLNFKKTSHA